jgi:glutathione S-transferase
MKLFYSPGACSLAPHIVLREAKQAFSLVKVDTGTHKLVDGSDYYAVNSKGQVPVLEMQGGQRLTEGPIIAQYIADQAGRADLIPVAGSAERYRVMEWQNFVTSELHKGFSPLFNKELNDEGKKTLSAALLKKYSWLDGQLKDKPYLTGSTFTVADAYLFTVTNWSKFVGLDLSGLKNLQAFMQRVAERPAVREAMVAEGLLS